MRRVVLYIFLLLVCANVHAKYWTPVQYEDSIRAAFRHGNWDQGRAWLVEADPEYGTLSTFCCLNGRYYYHQRDYDEARRYLILALRDDDANVEALELLVRVERETGNYATAIEHINHWLEFAPYDIGLWRMKIELYRMLGNNIEANRQLERLYTIYPTDSMVCAEMVYQHQMVYYDQHRAGNTAAEEEALKQILRVDPRNKEANRALNNLQRKRYNQIFERDRRNQHKEKLYEDSLNVQRTAKLSATLVMEAIREDERERRTDPDVVAARMLQEANSMIVDEQYTQALELLDHVDSIATDTDLLATSERRRVACMDGLHQKEERRFIGDAIDTSYVLLKRKEARRAVPLLDSVLVLDPRHNEANMLLSMSYEQLHQYDSADYYLRRYHPLPEEVFMIRRHQHTLAQRSHLNTINVEYQYARRSSLDQLTHNAYIQYTRRYRRETFGVQAAYAGRESGVETAVEEHTVIDKVTTPGGTGVQLGANWTHSFAKVPLETDIHLTWASRFFPQWTAGVRFTEELPHEWDLTEKLDYRRILNDDDNYHLLSLGLSTSKTINRFTLTPALDVYYMLSPTNTGLQSGVYFNGSLKMQYTVLEGDRSSVFAAVGVGNAPEATLLQNSMPVSFARLNTYVSGGFNWVIVDNLSAGFATSWYALGQQTANQSMVRNYLYINANLLISF